MKTVAVVLMSLLMSGCAFRLIDFTVISSKNIDLSRMDQLERVPERVVGEDAIYYITIIPTGIYPNPEEALDRAIESVPGGVALVDGVLTRKYYYIPLIYGKDWYEVEGSVLVDPTLLRPERPSKARVNF